MSIFRDTFQPEIKQSLEFRQNAMTNRTPQVIQYMNSRNSWIRMTSAVNVNGTNTLASQYVLQGGTLTAGQNLRSGVGNSTNDAYSNVSPSGKTNRLGIRPMPGITGISVKSKSAYGSLREELKSDNQQLKTKGSIPFQRFEFRNNYMNDPIKPSQIMYFDNGIENFEDYYYWEFPYYKAPVQPYKLVSPSITNKPTTPKSNNLVKPAPRETLSKMPISPIKKLDTNSIQAQPNLQTKEIPTTPSSNIKDQRTYTASKMLEKMGRPAGYINEGMNEGRQEITKSKGGVVKKYVKGGMLKPMGNDMYEVKSYKKGTDKVEYRPNVFIDNKEIIRKNSDGSTQILSDDLGYAKVAKNIARAKGGNITDEQFDQLYMNQEMSKASKGKGNKYVKGGTDKKLKLRNPMSDDRATLVSGNFDSFGVGNPKIEPMKSKSLAPMSIDKVNPKPFKPPTAVVKS